MNLFDVTLFIAKYIPFWTVPMGLISVHFAYLFWLKDYRDIAYFWGAIVFICLLVTIVYFLMGGPDGITYHLTQAFA